MATNKSNNTNSNKNTGKSTGKNSSKSTSNNNSKSSSKPEKAVKEVKLSLEEQEKLSQEETVSREIRDEAILIGTAVVSLLLILSNFKLSGKAGEAVNGVLFGLFGFLAYLVPVFALIVVAFFLANKSSSKKIYVSKIVAAVGVFVLLSAMIQLGVGETTASMKLSEYYTYAKLNKSGGGFIGGVLCRMLVPLFGLVGSYIILAALEIICLMIITGKAFLQIIKEYLDEKHEENVEKRKEYDKMVEDYITDEKTGDIVPEKKAKTFLLKDQIKPETEEEKPVEKKKNFFGGITPTKPVGLNRADESDDDGDVVVDIVPGMGKAPVIKNSSDKAGNSYNSGDAIDSLNSADKDLILNGKYTPSEDTKNTINSLYEDSLKKKFEGKTAVKGTNTFNNSGEPEKKEMSFSDAALRDRSAFENASPKTIFDEPPYALKKVNEKVGGKNSASQNTKGEKLITPDRVVEGKNKQMEFVPEKVYKFPPLDLLKKPVGKTGKSNENELYDTAEKLRSTLESFGVNVTITDISKGPTVTRYELQPEVGVKVSKITALSDDIKLNLAASDIRIEAPIPGKAAVGIEVPNSENTMVTLYELIDSKEFKENKFSIPFTVGKSIEGNNIVGDIAKMPHMLIAGSTGSGKSVCINTIIMSILYKQKPEDLKLIMIDPKVVELSVYNGIPHLLIPVVTDPKKAAAALNWACNEMDERYKKFAELSVRDLKGYNERVKAEAAKGNVDENYPEMPQMVIIVDELADLMMVASKDVEAAICRLAQKARACGIHLIIATQRPSVDVITGLIKANIPSRIAFAVTSGTDSRTILDGNGAEKLLGKGDMLYFPSGMPKPTRIQGAFVSDAEVNSVVDFLKAENDADYSSDVSLKIDNQSSDTSSNDEKATPGADNGRDEYFKEAGRIIIEKQKASVGYLQRALKIGFNRAARIMEQLADAGVVTGEEGTKARTILMTMEEYEAFLNSGK